MVNQSERSTVERRVEKTLKEVWSNISDFQMNYNLDETDDVLAGKDGRVCPTLITVRFDVQFNRTIDGTVRGNRFTFGAKILAWRVPKEGRRFHSCDEIRFSQNISESDPRFNFLSIRVLYRGMFKVLGFPEDAFDSIKHVLKMNER